MHMPSPHTTNTVPPPIWRHPHPHTHLVGQLESIGVGRQAHVRLLLAVGADEGVDTHGINVVHLLDGDLDLRLGGPLVHEEHKRVVLLNLLHGRLGGQRRLDDGELVHPRAAGHGLARVHGLAGKRQGLGAVERACCPDLARRAAVGTLEGGLLGRSGLSLGGACIDERDMAME